MKKIIGVDWTGRKRLGFVCVLLAVLAMGPVTALAQSITVNGGPGTEVGKLPHVVATFVLSGSVLPVNVFTLFDTGADRVYFDPDTVETLGITNLFVNELLVMDIRLVGMGALDPASLGTPVYPGTPQAELLGITTSLVSSPRDRTLLGGPVTQLIKAVIDYNNILTIGPYLDDPDSEIFQGPNITFCPPGSEVGFAPSITLNLQSILSITPPATAKGKRYLMYDISFNEGTNSVASNSISDGNTNVQGKRFLFDTGTTVTELDDDYADDLGLDLSDPPFRTPLGGSNVPGFYLDSITMSGPEGTFTVTNAPVVVVDLGLSLTAVIGSNIFSQVKLLWDGPEAKLGISLPSTNEDPVADAGADQTIEADGNPTSFTLDGTLSIDPDGDTLTYSWKDAGGNVVGTEATVTLSQGLGTYVFSLTVTDPSGLPAEDTVSITIRDTTPPVLAAPPDITVPESDPMGTAVNLGQPTVSDNYDTVFTVSSNAPALFPLGGTTVTWTVSDSSGNTSSAQQKVTVEPGTPLNQLRNLVKLINYSVASGGVAPEMQTSLLAKINAAIAALVQGNANASKVAMNDLKAFVNQVEAQTDKKITPPVAAEIIVRANRIIVVLGG
jgi:hypothetical protein